MIITKYKDRWKDKTIGYRNEKTIYGLIVSNKKDIRINYFIKIRHYLPIPYNDKKLCLKLCDSVNCQFYDDNTKQCIIEVQKCKCNMIIGRTKKQPNNIITIKQRKLNIEREFEIMIRNLQSFNNVTDSIIISLNIDQEKERDLDLICSANIKIEKL